LKGITKFLTALLTFSLFLSLIVLPANYATSQERNSVMHLTIGSSTLDLNGIPRGMDVAPFIENNRTWVPVRFVAENLAASVYWSQEDQKVTIVQLDKTISMTIGSSEIVVNGVGGRYMDVAPFIENNRTWVPVRFVSENLGAEVSWNQEKQEVTVVFPGEIGAVTRVVDGDTIHVGLSDRDWSVRLIGINTPETGQYYFEEAKDKMEELVGGKAVLLKKDVSETDRYGRLLRYVYLGDLFVNAEMVKEGYAQAATYPPDVKYADLFVSLEREARENGLGLWALASISPTPSSTPSPSPTQTTAANYIGNSNTKVFHRPTCKYVSQIAPEHIVYFSTREEAISAGYRPCKVCNP